MIGVAARYEATLMVFVFGVLVIAAVREADFVLLASGRVLIDMVIVFIFIFEPEFTEVAFLSLVGGFGARASGGA